MANVLPPDGGVESLQVIRRHMGQHQPLFHCQVSLQSVDVWFSSCRVGCVSIGSVFNTRWHHFIYDPLGGQFLQNLFCCFLNNNNYRFAPWFQKLVSKKLGKKLKSHQRKKGLYIPLMEPKDIWKDVKTKWFMKWFSFPTSVQLNWIQQKPISQIFTFVNLLFVDYWTISCSEHQKSWNNITKVTLPALW